MKTIPATIDRGGLFVVNVRDEQHGVTSLLCVASSQGDSYSIIASRDTDPEKKSERVRFYSEKQYKDYYSIDAVKFENTCSEFGNVNTAILSIFDVNRKDDLKSWIDLGKDSIGATRKEYLVYAVYDLFLLAGLSEEWREKIAEFAYEVYPDENDSTDSKERMRG